MNILQNVSLGALAIAISSGPAFAQVPDQPLDMPSSTETSVPPVEDSTRGDVSSYPNSNTQTEVQRDAPVSARAAVGSEIIVTARKRDETLISVPVVVTAVGGAQLAAQGITSLDGIAQVVPQLMIGNQGGAVAGGNISIRGIAGPDQNPFGDSAVSFNIDDVQVTKPSVRRLGDFDIAQVEVLKGPQALFFGKNSPAGIVNMRTADPTDVLEAKLSAGYEFNADQVRLEGYVSSPITESVGVRVAGFYSDMKGDLEDVTPQDSPYYTGGRNAEAEEWAVRGTAKFDNGGPFDARLKVSYGELYGDGPAARTAFTSCPTGSRFTTLLGGTINQCSAGDGANSNAGYGSLLSTIGGELNLFREDGENFQDFKQMLTGLVMNYELGAVTLTSVTGYYKVDLEQCQNYENDPTVLLPSCNVLDIEEFSQELRFFTDYDGPLNLSGGVYYADTSASTGSLTYLFGGNFPLLDSPETPGFGGPQTPAQINNYFFEQEGKAYSAYMEASFKPTDTIEINVGGRYTREEKELPLVLSGGGLADNGTLGTPFFDESTILLTAEELAAAGNPADYNFGVLASRKGAWTDFSPEVSISYRPSNDLTLFTSYKHGFLSGGFNSGSVTFLPPSGVLDLSYDPQTVKGFEAGVKALLLDGNLRANFAAYSYKISDQQVNVVVNTTNSIRNAAASKVKGVEFDFNYRTPLEGLSINGAAAYNDAEYTDYANAPCYGGQTTALGCVGGVQDLSGRVLERAPEWNVSAGFDYVQPIGDTLELGLNSGVSWVSSYFTDASLAPNGVQDDYALVNASLRLSDIDDRWEAALIGRNLTEEYYVVATSLVPFAFNPDGGLLDRFGTLSRGREVMLRLSYRFGGS